MTRRADRTGRASTGRAAALWIVTAIGSVAYVVILVRTDSAWWASLLAVAVTALATVAAEVTWPPRARESVAEV